MSYSLRNTILLAITLILILAGSGTWIYFTEYKELNERKDFSDSQLVRLANLQKDADRYTKAYDLNQEMNHRLNNFPKVLLPNSNLAYLYNYMRIADPGNSFMNFVFTDSTRLDDYGRIRFSIDGASPFHELRDFIQTVEQAAPMIKFTSLQIRPANNRDNLNEVVFRMTAEAFYDRSGRQVPRIYASAIRNTNRYNPFFPLIHEIPANTEDRVNVEQSRLTGLGDRFIFLIDQTGRLQRLELRDRVWLGYLESISQENQSATFFLNKGGLVERVTLRIKQ
jgi:hypothetical protein